MICLDDIIKCDYEDQFSVAELLLVTGMLDVHVTDESTCNKYMILFLRDMHYFFRLLFVEMMGYGALIMSLHCAKCAPWSVAR